MTLLYVKKLCLTMLCDGVVRKRLVCVTRSCVKEWCERSMWKRSKNVLSGSVACVKELPVAMLFVKDLRATMLCTKVGCDNVLCKRVCVCVAKSCVKESVCVTMFCVKEWCVTELCDKVMREELSVTEL